MNRTAGVLKMHWRDKWIWIYTPWIILLFSFAVNLIIGVLTGGQENINSGGIASIYVFMLIVILIVQRQTFPFALGMNVRRTDFFVGTSIMGMFVSAASSIVLFLLSILEKLSDGWGVHLFYFNIPFMNHTSLLARFGIYFIVMIHMFFLGFIISSIYLRYKKPGLMVFFLALFLIFSLTSFALTYYSRWLDLFHWIAHHYMDLFVWMVPVSILYAVLSYILLRRATVS
ncbi:hypothetical protein GRF59_09420 [Paenibacillus sp. HJL G12]|uniref:Uncharacterized protein n=1 Tax=Paenibacillus dendrobii TaxID=2691084 RepID=A0A7X3LHR9_9BACL|nr:hypothetical protein [Paenibacillus dendrobii]MWV43853.1 hypothetical protein [Paenibacillus dendrobii]